LLRRNVIFLYINEGWAKFGYIQFLIPYLNSKVSFLTESESVLLIYVGQCGINFRTISSKLCVLTITQIISKRKTKEIKTVSIQGIYIQGFACSSEQ